ncbi:hypothetical protein B0T24DRAFT_287363 [Lasiosphaeria ovina]|uniref:Uncharacterized protein n=1 Tax=Lasiosphaeria ovina TaxID=92902 RepID=A0AAE0KDE1_9PEZI|nr:hypothetical protein B0T24DRAFT_287363 [Lasiosphaeria ovina]
MPRHLPRTQMRGRRSMAVLYVLLQCCWVLLLRACVKRTSKFATARILFVCHGKWTVMSHRQTDRQTDGQPSQCDRLGRRILHLVFLLAPPACPGACMHACMHVQSISILHTTTTSILAEIVVCCSGGRCNLPNYLGSRPSGSSVLDLACSTLHHERENELTGYVLPSSCGLII